MSRGCAVYWCSLRADNSEDFEAAIQGDDADNGSLPAPVHAPNFLGGTREPNPSGIHINQMIPLSLSDPGTIIVVN